MKRTQLKLDSSARLRKGDVTLGLKLLKCQVNSTERAQPIIIRLKPSLVML